MLIRIFDVGHGNFAQVLGDHDSQIVIDCGCEESNQSHASIGLLPFINLLVISHFDEDHVSELPFIYKNCFIDSIVWNPSIGKSELRKLKDEIVPNTGVSFAYDLVKDKLPGELIPEFPIWAPVSVWAYYNSYSDLVCDTNNLSLAVFVRYGNFTILFSGDLEESGWERLLQNRQFCRDLRSVNILVASHHGRINGQCYEVFDYCRPDLIVFSDGEKVHETQDTLRWYYDRTKGLPVNGTSKERRILTTRNDGNILIDVDQYGYFWIRTDNRMDIFGRSKLQTSLPVFRKGYLPWELTQAPPIFDGPL